jgi:hypothetical protein
LSLVLFQSAIQSFSNVHSWIISFKEERVNTIKLFARYKNRRDFLFSKERLPTELINKNEI